MARHSQIALPPMEVKTVAPTREARDNSLVLKQRFLREAIDESGWKHDAVAAAIGVDGPYLSKMLAGEKPITLRHLDGLPGDIEAIYSKKYAEHHGHVIVTPAAGDDAVRLFASGLLGILAPARKIASAVLVAGVLFGAGRPVAAQSSAAGVIARQVLTDPTTYTPAVANYVFSRLDWASSQPLFARGYLEQDPAFTLSGRADAAPVPDGVGRQQILMNAWLVLGWSAAANVGARVLERQLRARDPEHARRWRAVSLALRVGVAGVLIDADVLPHVRQWRTNLAMAGGLQ